MVDVDYKKKASELVKLAKEKGLIKKYAEFCSTDEAKKYALSKEDVIYYTSKGDCMMKSIVEEKLVSFKTLEQKIFSYVCELGREMPIVEAMQTASRKAFKKAFCC